MTTDRLNIKYDHAANTTSDINEHIPTLKKYAMECNFIVELGVRGIVSSWGLLAGLPNKMVSVDIMPPSNWGSNIEELQEIATEAGVNFQFILSDSCAVTFDFIDLLFIDTAHHTDQLAKELRHHAPRVMKYIILHDTTLYEFENERGGAGGLGPALVEFLSNNSDWQVKEKFTNNNGLTVLSRISGT